MKDLVPVCLLLLLSLSLVRSRIPETKATENATLTFDTMHPSTGDDWTEQTVDYFIAGSGATKTWTTTEIQYGSKALNITHTAVVATSMSWYFVLPAQTDVTAYEYLWFKAKFIYTAPPTQFAFYMQNLSVWKSSSPYIRWNVNLKTPYNNWFTVCIALNNGEGMNGGTPANILNKFRNIYFYFDTGVVQSKANLVMDGLRFCTVSTTMPRDWTQYQKLHNVIYMMEHAEHTYTYLGKSYTTLYKVINMTTGVALDDDGVMHSEANAQTIHALCIAYQHSGFSYFKTKAEQYIQLYLAQQGKTGPKFVPDNAATPTSGGMLANSWQLSALSQLYGITNNSTYKTAADGIRSFLMDIMWNGTNNWFDSVWNNGTQKKTYAGCYVLLYQGSATSALAEYYCLVNNNATVKARVDYMLNKMIGSSPPSGWTYKTKTWLLDGSQESTCYAAWGFYYAWKAFSNTTYQTAWNNIVKRQIEQETVIGRSGQFAPYSAHAYFEVYTTSTQMDKWGGSQKLVLASLAYSDYPHVYGIVTSQLFDFWARNQSLWGWEFRDDATWKGKIYLPMTALIEAANQFYTKYATFTEPTIVFSSGNITSVAPFADGQFKFAFYNDVGKTSVAKVYVGDKGKPTSVNGAASWSYDAATRILMVTAVHSGSIIITVKWKFPGDVNGDDAVNATDLLLLNNAYGSTGGPPPSVNWNPNVDINGDNDVNILDLHILGKNYGKTDP